MTAREATLLADGFVFLEAPKWQDGKVWISDVMDGAIYTVTLDGRREKVCAVPGKPAGLGFMPDGTLIIASLLDKKLLQWSGGVLSDYRDLSMLAGPPNDFVIDGKSRIYLGDFGYDRFGGEAPKATNLVRIDPDRSISIVAEDVEFPNGAAIINDGRTLVVNETWVGRITAFDLSEDGTLANRRLFADLGDRGPDGMCADAEGALWIGCYNSGDVLRVKDGGEITHHYHFNGGGISCALGGEDGHTLFMTCFIGAEADITRRRTSAIYTDRVDVGAPQGLLL
jgi:sugar lactone lactonase YvrE